MLVLRSPSSVMDDGMKSELKVELLSVLSAEYGDCDNNQDDNLLFIRSHCFSRYKLNYRTDNLQRPQVIIQGRNSQLSGQNSCFVLGYF